MAKCPNDECRTFLVQQMAAMGVEAVASPASPIIPPAYGATSFICPHGVEYWLEPTSDQIAAWAKAGTR
jgi:hypothetical protein